MATAVERLSVGAVSDQLEALTGDVDLPDLTVWKAGRRVVDLLPRVTDGTITRTIEGASTVTVTVVDPELEILQTVLTDGPLDIRIDGLWFRLVAFNKQVRQLTLTFEDRVVNLLRRQPAKTAPHNGWRAWPASRGTGGGVTRVQFAEGLVRDVAGVSFVAPGGVTEKTPIPDTKSMPAASTRVARRDPGFAPGARVNVKGRAATSEQRRNLDIVLTVGASLGLGASVVQGRKILVASVMTGTQESDMVNLPFGDLDSRGVFQQRPSQGWPASGDVATDAKAFFEKAIEIAHQNPSLPVAQLCSEVQRDYTFGTSREGDDYAKWRTEAEQTVSMWGLTGGDTADTRTLAAHGSALALPADTSFQYTRGTIRKEPGSGKPSYVREDDWACLQRLAQEVQWRCFPVSGTVYFVNDPWLFQSQPMMTLSDQADGVDSIDGDYDVGKKTAQLTVSCRIGRWQAPPGSVVELEDLGPLNGRWLVTTISRPIFSASGTVTLAKPQPVLPESSSPEMQQTATGGTVFAPGAAAGGQDAPSIASAIVAAAEKAAATRRDYAYKQSRPMPSSLFSGPTPRILDCSSFATLCYKAAGALDPNQFGYNGQGNTRTLAANGDWTLKPQPGDLVFYGASKAAPEHVAVYTGDGGIVNMGSPGEPRSMKVVDVGLPLLGYKTYELTSSAADEHHHGGAAG